MKSYSLLALALAGVLHLSSGCTEPVEPVTTKYVPPAPPPAPPPPPPPPTARSTRLAARTPTTLIGFPGTEIQPLPAVYVSDQAGQTVAGAVVTFEVISGGGSITGGSVTSDSSGIARPGGWTLGVQGGVNVARARLAAADSQSVEFTAAVQVPCASPCATGAQLAFVREGDIYAMNEDGSNLVRITSSGTFGHPAWSPDGRQIAFVLGNGLIYLINADGSDLRYFAAGQAPAWSPDGRRIAFSALHEGDTKIFVVPVRSDDGPSIRVGHERGYNTWPAWSPDGKKIAFTSDWSAFDFATEIYIANADGSDIVQLTDGFFGSRESWPAYIHYTQPAWSPDGLSLAVVACPEWQFTPCAKSSIGIISASQPTVGVAGFRSLATTTGLAKPTWTANGLGVEFSRTCWEHKCESHLYRVTMGGGNERRVIENGHSGAWRR